MTDVIKLSLFNSPSFTKGVARTVSLFGHLDEYNTSKSPEEADGRALYEDWKIVGLDLKEAIKQYGKKPSK